MSIMIKVAIGLPVALFSSGFILTMVVSLYNTYTHTHTLEMFHALMFILISSLQWLQYQKQKMFWDESWIINYKNIIFGKMTHAEVVKRYCLQIHISTDTYMKALDSRLSLSSLSLASGMDHFNFALKRQKEDCCARKV